MLTPNKRIRFIILTILLMASIDTYGQFYSVQTNALNLATGTFNVEGSAALGRRWTLHLPVQYNPWTFPDNRKIKNFSTFPGIRYWLTESYGRCWFMGIHGIVSRYNIGLWGANYRYDGMAYGMGLSGGYSRPLGIRWNIEFELGAGAVWTTYDKYPCMRCGRKLETGSAIRFVPDRLAVSLVYLF